MNGLRDISEFHFVWPAALLLLLLIPLGWFFYAGYRRQRLERQALQFSYAAMAAQLKQQTAAWKRLLFPVSVSMLAACMIFSLARPTIIAKVPVSSVDMMLVLDISLSMMAEDIRPSRIDAARDAAVRFVESMPPDARIGLEVFAGDNYVLSPPTSRHDEVIAYLKALRKEDLKIRTEIGSALHTALRILSGESRLNNQKPQAPDNGRKPDQVIILLSDGDSHEGYPWDQAARDAVKDHVTIHTVGIGSVGGSIIQYHGMELPVSFDETTLRQIAEIGGGSYFRVFTEEDFRKVYDQLQARTVHYEEQSVDLSFVLAGLALLILAGSLALGSRV